MAMGVIWTALVLSALVCGAVNGRLDAVTAAALEGAGAAVELVLCSRGLAGALDRRLRPVLGRLLPGAAHDRETMEAVSANVSANLLGLGNAATPAGIRAAKRLAQGCGGTASDDLCRLVVLNTASVQLLPTTVASVRAGLGCGAPLDILPAVWVSSILSVTAGLAAAGMLRRVWGDRS